MNKLLNILLRSTISASLSDRETFTNKVADVIEPRIGDNPELAQKLSEKLASAMDSINDELFFEQLFNNQSDTKSLEDKIDKLTESIDRLNSNLEKMIEK